VKEGFMENIFNPRGSDYRPRFELKVLVPDADELFMVCGQVKSHMGQPISISKEGLTVLLEYCVKGLKDELPEGHFSTDTISFP
jgi:hypothetical protein